MSERTRELEREIEELRRVVEFLERRVVATEEERSKSAAQIPVSPGPSAEDVPYARPFEVDYDPEDEEYYIFAPPGCVLVDGHEVEIADVDTESHTVSLDCLNPDNMPDALYAHVTQDASSTGGYKVEFDDEETKEGALFNFRVCRFGSSENDGNQYDLCASVVCLGGGTDKPRPYEVRWDDSLDGGSGGYKIYLPAAEGLLSFWGDEVATSTFTGVGSLGASTRWFSLDDVSASAQDVWLVITVGFSNGMFDGVDSVELSDTQGTASTGTIVRNVRVAELFSTGHVVRQALVGALHIGHKLVAGDDTNLRFAPAANGEDIKVDVYYA